MNAVCAFAVCVLILGTSNLTAFVPEGLAGEPYRDYQSIAARLDANMGDGESVYYLSFDYLQAAFRIYYYADHIEITGGDDILGDDLTDAETLETDRDTVFGCDYLYVADVRDQFNDMFRVYNGGEDYIEGALYRVERDDNNITVTMVYDGQ